MKSLSRLLVGILVNCAVAGSLVAAAVIHQGQPNQISPEQVREIHGALYSASDFLMSPNAISKAIALRTGDVTIRSEMPRGNYLLGYDPSKRIKQLACDSVGIIEGRALASKSYVTLDQGAIYTEWQFADVRVLKAVAQRGTNDRGAAVVLRMGGTVEDAGRKISVVLDWQEPLQAGTRYLMFFTQFVPQTGAFASDFYFVPFADEKVKTRSGRAEGPLDAFKRSELLDLTADAVLQQLYRADCKH